MLRWDIKKIASIKEFPIKEIEHLWKLDSFYNPFCSPKYLQVHTDICLKDGQQVFLAMGYDEDNQLNGLWPLRLDKKGILRFLQFLYADQRACLKTEAVDIYDMAEGLQKTIVHINPKGIIFHNVSSWNDTMKAILLGLKKVRYYILEFEAGICYLAVYDKNIKNLFNVRKKNRLIQKIKKLQKEQNLKLRIDVNPDEKRIKEWLKDFIPLHIKRWKNTPTPSKYESADEQQKLFKVLRAWTEDRILLLFTLYISEKPVAFNGCVRAGKRIIFVHHAVDLSEPKWSPGSIIHILIGQWMLENGYEIYDFGLGDEEYKKRFSDSYEMLWRIYAGPYIFSRTYLEGYLEKQIRQFPKLVTIIKWLKKLWRKK